MKNNLSTLSVLHYVYGGLICVGGLFMLIFIGLGTMLQSDLIQQQHDAPPEFIGGIFQVIGWVLFAFMEALGIFIMFSGSWIANRRNRTASLIVAGICCLTGLLGIGLGIFTFVTLLNDEVKRDYDSRQPAIAPSGY